LVGLGTFTTLSIPSFALVDVTVDSEDDDDDFHRMDCWTVGDTIEDIDLELECCDCRINEAALALQEVMIFLE
jgi:hypothetical protein